MLSFKKGRKIARIRGGKRNGDFIYLTDEKHVDRAAVDEVVITDGKVVPLPNQSIVEKIYVSAPSGAGKSTWVGSWISEFKKMFRDDELFLFSSVEEDEALDRHDPIRIELGEDLIDDPIEPEELSNSLVVFDDTDTIRSKAVRGFVAGFRPRLRF